MPDTSYTSTKTRVEDYFDRSATGVWAQLTADAKVSRVRLIAWAQARASIHTITTDRIILRIGAALPVTYTIPFRRMAAAHLEARPDGTGTIAVEISDGLRLSYAVLWPHLRPGQGSPAAARAALYSGCHRRGAHFDQCGTDQGQRTGSKPRLARRSPGSGVDHGTIHRRSIPPDRA